MKETCISICVILASGIIFGNASEIRSAEIGSGDQQSGNSAAQANNPLADSTAFNLQNYYIGELTDSDEDANQFWLRYATPISIGNSDWLIRASLPVNTYPTSPSFNHETGLGDINVFAAYMIDVGNPSISFGVGPQITMPTATEDGYV